MEVEMDPDEGHDEGYEAEGEDGQTDEDELEDDSEEDFDEESSDAEIDEVHLDSSDSRHPESLDAYWNERTEHWNFYDSEEEHWYSVPEYEEYNDVVDWDSSDPGFFRPQPRILGVFPELLPEGNVETDFVEDSTIEEESEMEEEE
jgi:hypothetical protein